MHKIILSWGLYECSEFNRCLLSPKTTMNSGPDEIKNNINLINKAVKYKEQAIIKRIYSSSKERSINNKYINFKDCIKLT